MTKRSMKIGNSIIEKIWKNGGHWVELSMKNGDKLYIQRGNFQSFGNLEREKFNVSRNGEKILSNVTLSDLSNYIDINF